MNNTSFCFCEDACHSFTCQSTDEYSVRIVASDACHEWAGAAVTHVNVISEYSSCPEFTRGRHQKPAEEEIAIYKTSMRHALQ